MKKTTTKLLTALLTLCIVLTLMPMTAFADSKTYAVKFYPGDHGTMTKNDQIPFVYYGIDDDVNKPYYYKLNVSETEILSFASSIINVLSPNPGYEFAYWTADAAVCLIGSDTPISAGTALSSDQIQSKITVKSDVTFTAHFKQISEYPDGSEITNATIEDVRFNYGAGEAPVASAFVTAVDYEKYDVAYECWQQFENNEPVAAWYSDNGSHGSLPTFKEFEADKSYTYGVYFKISDLGMEEGYRFDQNTKLYINGEEITLTPDQIDVDDSGETIWFSNVLTMTPSTVKVIDVVEINDVTVSFKNGDKPVFTGKSPEGVKYAYNCEWWELDSKTGAISADFFSGAYENKITTFESGKTYHYGVYVKAVGFVESENTSYIFGPDTKLKINGEFVNYKRYENDTSDGSDGTLWVITDLTMTPRANDTSSDNSDTNSDSKDTSSNNSTNTNSNSNTDSKNPVKNNAGSTNPNTGNNVSGILLTFVIAGSGLVIAGRRSRKNK